jgi:hypothetical protein
MQDFEKLGVFYLGRPYDPNARKRGDGWLLYDSRDLVTHAVCVGMTGSGKTGLCLALLEEAAIDGVPAIAIDPKGDLGNLLLTFPELRPQDFQPWVNPDDARRGGVSVEEYAAQQADRWKKGLAEWGEDGERIARLRASADFAIYTPGSEAGIPVSILRTLAAPAGEIDGEALRERVTTTVSSLLGLLGLEADPVRSRDHILLSTILQHAWSKGQDLDLGALIQAIQAPPIARIGVLDLESFYPAKDRFALAMSLNNLLASPGFAAWMEGEPLDVQRLLYTPEGKPRVSIFSISHLGDAERMFFVSLLLSQIVGWMRQQSGTTSLRALVYMDEIFGYFPPVANPPSKLPLLTLLKQGRAFGVGTVLATQNPVDLDYKGLANAGTWFLGRLQTERDKARVIEGLEGASASAGKAFDRGQMERTLAGLGSRVFLMNNVHEDVPVVFESRWALCYLRGPLGRQEIKRLMDPCKAGGGPGAEPHPAPGTAPGTAPSTAPGTQHPAPSTTHLAPGTQHLAPAAGPVAAPGPAPRPVLPPGIDQYFVPVRGSAPAGCRLVYEPMLLGSAQVRFADPKAGVDRTDIVNVLAPISDEAVPVDWESSRDSAFAPGDLEREAAEDAGFAALPAPAAKPKSYDAWKKAFGAWVYGSRKLALLSAPDVGLLSEPGETEGQFRVRVQQAAREKRDQAVEALRVKYAARLARLQDQLRRAQQAREREASQATASKMQTAISFGATLLGALVGRKTVNLGTIGRATTAARGVGRSMKEAEDVKRAALSVEAAQQQIDALESELRTETEALETRIASGPFESVTIAPKKTGITVQIVTLAWTPCWQDTSGKKTPAS